MRVPWTVVLVLGVVAVTAQNTGLTCTNTNPAATSAYCAALAGNTTACNADPGCISSTSSGSVRCLPLDQFCANYPLAQCSTSFNCRLVNGTGTPTTASPATNTTTPTAGAVLTPSATVAPGPVAAPNLYCPGTNTTYQRDVGNIFLESASCDPSQGSYYCSYSCCPGPNALTCYTCGCEGVPPGLADFYNAACNDLGVINDKQAFCTRLAADNAAFLNGTCRASYDAILNSFGCNELSPAAAPTFPAGVPSPAPVVTAPQTRSSSSGGAIGGAVGGAVGGLAVLVALSSFFIIRRKRRNRRDGAYTLEAGKPAGSLGGSNGGWQQESENPFAVNSILPKQVVSLDNLSLHDTAVSGSLGSEAANTGKGTFNPFATPEATRSPDATKGTPERTVVDSANSQDRATAPAVADIAVVTSMAPGAMLAARPSGTESGSTTGTSGMSATDNTARSSSIGDATVPELVDASLPNSLQNTWQIDPTEIKIYMENGTPKVLGEGGFGKVFKGTLHGTTDVAIKIATHQSAKQTARFVREIATLRACLDPNIVRFLGASLQQSQTLLVMEYMPGGDLYRRIALDDAGEYLWYRRGAKLAQEIAAGLVYLHAKRILHLDLKSPNILLAADGSARVADVGLGKFIAGVGTIATSEGSFMWASPEQLEGAVCSEASDMYSFGTVLWEIVTGEQPLRRIMRMVKVPDECPQPVADLIYRCHDRVPANRPTAKEAHHIIEIARRSARSI